jgi:hypothetical protein
MHSVSPAVRYSRIAAYTFTLLCVACTGNQQGNEAANGGGSPAPTPIAAPIDGIGRDALAAFAQTTWTQILSSECYGCHHSGGMAQRMGSGFIFMDKNLPNSLAHNLAIARAMAALDSNLFLLKATMQVGHYGGQVIDPNSAQYTML